MKIRVEEQQRSYTISLPSGLLFSRGAAWLLQHASVKIMGCDLTNLTDDQVKRLFAELRRIKTEYGSWELVEIHTASGKKVTISL